jgi:hypothetical protein
MPVLLLRISRFVAFALLSLTLVFPWFRVPVALRENVKGVFTPVFKEPASTAVFRILLVGVLLGACWIKRWPRHSSSLDWAPPMTISGCLLLAVFTIGYPALTVQRCAEVSAHAAWLQAQHYSFIVPSGDAFTAQEYEYEPGQPEVGVKEIIPRAFEAFPTPLVNSFSDLHLARLEEILMWLGLSPAFCQFVYRGWFCGIFGSFLLAVSFMQMKGAERARRWNRSLRYCVIPLFLFGTFLLGAVCVLPVVMAGRELAKAQIAVVEGRFNESLHHLGLAQALVPVLAYHTDLIYQRGWLERKLGFNSPAAKLLSAIREEEEGFNARAVQHYIELLGPEMAGPIRDEAFRGTLRLTIKDFNAGLVDRAGFRLAQLMAIDPTCLKANYALQLVDLRTLREERLKRDVARFEAVYDCFQSLEKRVVLASAHRRLASLEFDSGDIGKLGDEMRAAIKP